MDYGNDFSVAELETGRGRFWGGFAAGALIGTAAAVAAFMVTNAITGRREQRILRLEDSVQIGRPVEEVFRAWTDFERLPNLLDIVKRVRVNNHLTDWEINIDSKDMRWRARTVQFIPNEAIGWKSISGPKHTGRITFSRINEDTLMHVTVNYAPPLGGFAGLFSPGGEYLEAQINSALRKFKHALESRSGQTRGETERVEANLPPERASWEKRESELRRPRASGTFGAERKGRG